jgi:hypothetical protein
VRREHVHSVARALERQRELADERARGVARVARIGLGQEEDLQIDSVAG